jgi:1-deoxyxylulose-5-phosphate synthase
MPVPPRFQPRRPLGRTGFEVTQLGIGDLADRSVERETCIATLRRALDAGLNVVDTAPSYEDGYGEEIVGAALRGRGESIFLIDKIDHLDRPVDEQVDASLRRLGLPSVDLLVFHGVSSLEDWDRIARPGGRMDELTLEQSRARTQFRGISSHHPDVLRAALADGRCEVLMFPVGPYCHPDYVEEILPRARAQGVGTVAFKTFGAGKLLGDTEGYNQPLSQRPRGKLSSGGVDDATPTLPHLSVEQCLHYTLTMDPDVTLLGLSFPNEQDAAWDAAERFVPLSPEQLAHIRQSAQEAIKDKGRIWWDPPQ